MQRKKRLFQPSLVKRFYLYLIRITIISII